jgi:hypothetical protein
LKILFLEGLDWCPIFCGIDFRPKVFTIGIQAWLIGIDALPAVLLPMALPFAEDAGHFVPVGIISWIRSSLLLISRVVTEVVLGSEIRPSLVSVLLLASILVGGVRPLLVLRDCLNVVLLFFLLNCLYFVLAFSFILGAELNGCESNSRVQIQHVHWLEIDDSSQIR